MNKLEKILELSKRKGFECLNEECQRVMCINCSVCKVLGTNEDYDCMMTLCAEQLLEPYEEPKKLTKRERAELEKYKSGWIARDYNGNIYHFHVKPFKWKFGMWVTCDVENEITELIEGNLFPFIKWEDEEPYSVEELLKWDYEKE